MRSAVIAPMLARGKSIGVLSLLVLRSQLRRGRSVDRDAARAQRAAAAIDNARLFESERRTRIRVTKLLESEQRSNARLRLLARVSETATAAARARRITARHRASCWCQRWPIGASSTWSKRAIRRVATVHQDPAKVERARRVSGRYQPQLGDDSSIARVIAAGKAYFYPQLEAKLLERAARDEEELELLRGEGLVSTISVCRSLSPAPASGRCL